MISVGNELTARWWRNLIVQNVGLQCGILQLSFTMRLAALCLLCFHGFHISYGPLGNISLAQQAHTRTHAHTHTHTHTGPRLGCRLQHNRRAD